MRETVITSRRLRPSQLPVRADGEAGKGAVHLRGGRRCAPASLCFPDSMTRRATHSAPKAALFGQARRARSRSAQARGHGIGKTQAPRKMRRTLPGLAVAVIDWHARDTDVPARQAVPGVGDLCGGCEIRSGTGARFSAPRCKYINRSNHPANCIL